MKTRENIEEQMISLGLKKIDSQFEQHYFAKNNSSRREFVLSWSGTHWNFHGFLNGEVSRTFKSIEDGANWALYND